jgi:putative peptide zinc metalloprotease protein
MAGEGIGGPPTGGPPQSVGRSLPEAGATGSAVPAATVQPGASAPARADGVQLIGEMAGSGYREPPSLVRRADGQTFRLTPLVYLLLSAVDGRRTVDELAGEVSADYGRRVSAGNVQTLIDRQLRPLGLLLRPDGSQPEVKKAAPLLGLRLRYAVTDAATTRRLTAPFARLFNPLIVATVLAAFAIICWWVLAEKGLGSATYQAFHTPGLLLLIFVVTVLSGGFHEFGHAAAARRGGATPGVMGAAFYLFWPAFYTDVTDSYRLGRGGRIRTDLGGLYFNAIVVVAVAAAWWFTRHDGVLLLIAFQLLQMLRQLIPFVRFDGYHVLADITGVPDLFRWIKPTLAGLLPWRWGDPETRVLKPWARAVVTAWVLLVVPLLLFVLWLIIVSLPRLMATAAASAQEQRAQLAHNYDGGALLAVGDNVLSLIAIALPILASVYILARLSRQLFMLMWRRAGASRPRRALVIAAATAAVAALAWAWWPDAKTYRPVQPYERGTIADVVAVERTGLYGSQPQQLTEGSTGQAVAYWPSAEARPTAEEPQLALVLVPREDAADPVPDGTDVDGSGTSPATTEPVWVFPFDRPLPPETGDNQALAVNTTDGSVVYDVAFALVWVEEDTVTNSNEAYALASCQDCATVAVGFQVVLIAGQANVIVPENISMAVNYNCVECLTYALASQLVLTVDGELSEEGQDALLALWAELVAFGSQLAGMPLSEIEAELASFQERFKQIITEDQAAGQADGSTDTAGTETAVPEEDSTGPSTDTADGTTDTAPAGEDSPPAPDSEPLQDEEAPAEEEVTEEPEPEPEPTTAESQETLDSEPEPAPTGTGGSL